VACGYSQILGIDFNESFAPVINDVSFRIMLIAKLIWNLEASIVDVESAFLHGELQEEIYMNIPEEMSYDSKHCLLLTKTIYGLVQSAREFYKKFMATLKSIGFNVNKSQDGVIMIRIYVDGYLVIGKRDKINELIVALKTSGFNLNVENNLTDYLSCKLTENAESKIILLLKLHPINNLETKFGDKVKSKMVYKTLGTSRFEIVRPDNDDNIIEPNLHSRYRSGVFST
jgi:hypothetical protein